MLMRLYVCRLGVIEEEREEDERKLNVAVAAVDRLNVLVGRVVSPWPGCKCTFNGLVCVDTCICVCENRRSSSPDW